MAFSLGQHIQWVGDARTGHLRLLDQTRLPNSVEFFNCRCVEDVWGAIKRLSVRGAPAIGIAAAYGCVIGAQEGESGDSFGSFCRAAEYLATSRPTAVNLFWAIDRMRSTAERWRVDCGGDDQSGAGGGAALVEVLLDEAVAIHDEDRRSCREIGRLAFELLRGDLPAGETTLCMLTHCNAGSLATGGIGTATAPMYYAKEQGFPVHVYMDETRPLLQGARLTAWELGSAGISTTLITDNMAASVLQSGRVHVIITGADRIAANGDTANKIGTYGLAVLAKHHGIPFYVAAPTSTIDLSTPDGSGIPIEERSGEEIVNPCGMLGGDEERMLIAPEGQAVYNPAFDVTPADLITAIVTERGVVQPVDGEMVRAVCGGCDFVR